MRKRNMFLGSSALLILLTLAVAIPLYAAGTLSADFGKFIEFKPLVRHMISQVHCYDVGTNDCETTSHFGSNFTKEHTLGFLLDGSRHRMNALNFKPLYLCEARDGSGVMMVTGGLLENDPRGACRAAGFRYKQAGYISSTNQIEAPFPLYRCVQPTTHDTLLTHDASECTTALYGSAELLGYLYAGGPLLSQ